MAENVNVGIVVSAIDKATTPLRGIVATLGGITKSLAVGFGAGIGFGAFQGISDLAGRLASLPGQVVDVGIKFEQLAMQLESLEGSSDKAQRAMDWITDFAKRTPLELDQVVSSYAQLRTFGLDPTNGTLQALVDTMAKSGKGADHLSGIILAVGQAWTKQKLQGEEALQLIERGVPVWDLLAKATGRTAVELQEMASKGKLGRDAISALVVEMGKAAEGSSARFATTWTGLMSNISDAWTQFQMKIAQAGFFDALKQRLSDFLALIDQMAANGSLDRLAKQIGEGLTQAVDAAVRGVSALWEILKQWADPTGQAKSAVDVLTAAGTKLSASLSDIGRVLSTIIDLMRGAASGAAQLADALGPLLKVGGAVNKVNSAIWNAWGAVGRGVSSLTGAAGEKPPAVASSAPSAAAVDARTGQTQTKVGGAIDLKVTSDPGTSVKVGKVETKNKAVPLRLDSGLSMSGF